MAQAEAGAYFYEVVQLLQEEIKTIVMVLEHQREVFYEMLRCRESSHETLDKRLKWRIETHLDETLQHFQLLGESAAQAKFWVRPCRSARTKRLG